MTPTSTHVRRRIAIAALLVAGATLAGREARATTPQLGCSATSKTCAAVPPEVAMGQFAFILQNASACLASPPASVSWQYAITAGGAATATATCKTPQADVANDRITYTCDWAAVPAASPAWHLDATVACGGNVKLPADRVNATPKGGSAQKPAAGIAPGLPYLGRAEWRAVIDVLRLPLPRNESGNYYNRKRNVAVLFFDADGQTYYPMLDMIDEDDDIYVAVVDDIHTLDGLQLSISGCNRPPVEGRVYGSISAAAQGRLTGTGTPPVVPGIVIRPVGKCAGADSGGPSVTFTRGQQHAAVTIPVNQLYRYAVGVALAYDGTAQRTFDVRPAAGDTIPRVVEMRDKIGLTSLIYVSLYLAPRDFRKTDLLIAQRLQLFVGLDPRAFSDHLVAGIGYEIAPGMNLLAGWRVLTRQPVLAEGSGLSNGSTFDGPKETLPLRERWESGGGFIGVGLSSSLIARLR